MPSGVTYDAAKFQRLMTAMAEVKNVPLTKVVRNCARDFVKAAYMSTPVAKKTTKWLPIYFKGGGKKPEFYVDVTKAPWGDSMPIRHRNRAGEYKRKFDTRLVGVMYRGFAKSSWIGTMKALGMNGGRSSRYDFPAAQALATAKQGGTEVSPWTLIQNAVPYIEKLNLKHGIVRAGMAAAQGQMERELAKIGQEIVTKCQQI